MKTATLIFCVTGVAVTALAESGVGMRVAPPSQRSYSIEAIRESGERGGMLLPVGTNFTAVFNREMGDAMELWNAHRWNEGVAAFRQIWQQQQPDSPWAAEAELHEACYLKFNARYDEAEERFLSVLSKYPGSIEMRNKVLRYLPHLYAQTGRYQTGLDLLAEMQKLPLGWQERQYLENYSRLFARALAKDNADRLCGTKALALAVAAQNDQGESLRNVSLDSVFKRQAWAKEKATHAGGFSLQDLAAFANGQPVGLDLEALRAAAKPGHPVLVHLKSPAEPKCFSIFSKPQRQNEPPLSGHFVVVETMGASYVDLLDPDAGRVRWPLAHFLYRWSGTALRLAGQNGVNGQAVSSERAQSLRGGCCGSPPPDPSDECGGGDGEGDGSGGSGGSAGGINAAQFAPDRFGGPSSGGASCTSCGGSGGDCCEQEEEGQEAEPNVSDGDWVGFGAPRYQFGLSSANLKLKDIPLWGTDAKGPRLNLQLIFNRVATQRMATNAGANYYVFGNKWSCNLFSHLTQSPDGASDFVLPGGRIQRFDPPADTNGAVVYRPADIWNQNSMTQSGDRFVLQFKTSGNKWYFNTNTALEQRLEKIEDKHGNALTFQYESPSGRLTNVVDAIGRYFRFYYNGNGYVTNVADAFGRNAWFTYQNGDLVALTDMGGLTTTIQYDTNHWPTNVIYPSGNAWKFHYTYGQNALYPPYWQPFRMQAEDPLNQTNEYFYHAFWTVGPITLRDPAGNNRLMAHQVYGGDVQKQRVFYHGVNAQVYGVDNDTSQQREYRDYDLNLNLLRTFYPDQPVSMASASLYPVAGLAVTNLYDERQNLLTSTVLTNFVGDSGDMIGTWTNWYDGRDNPLGTKNPLNQTTRYAYSAKDELTAVTNALNYVTRMVYDQNGNLTNLVDALRRTNRWTYDANGRNFETFYADGLRLSRGYDALGRVNAVTNHGSGLYLSYFYDNLNRMRDVLFPDGTSNHWDYSCCGLDWTRDRLNRVTSYGRDALGRTTSVTDPENRLVEFCYNGANQITNLITHVSGQTRQKHFDYTSTNGFSRLTQVTTPMGKLIRYDYTFRGGLAWRQDGNGNVTKYQYDPLNRLVSVTDSNDAPLASMSYDVLGNVTHVASTNSVFDYTYDSLNRTTQAVCLLTNIPGFSTVKYKIDYAFDPVGNVTNRVITGLQGMSGTITTRYQYDVMNRLTNMVQLTNGATSASAWYAYDGAARLWKKGYGNNDMVTHAYDSESRLLSLGITNNTTPVLWYRYGWDNGGNILSITNNNTNVTLYAYDRAGQLTNEICLTNGFAGGETNSWVYDEAGNWLNAPGGGQWLYNADNELVARGPAGTPSVPSATSFTLTGEVEPGPQSNKWFNTWAECQGVQRQVSTTDGTFTLPGISIDQWGYNYLDVTVRDVSGNVAQQRRTVVKGVTNALETFHYDGNGNLTNWVNGATNWVYEWDWADRLTKATSNGIVVLENWYGSDRRVAKQELVSGETRKWLYVSDGWNIIGMLNGSGQLRETYTRGVGLAGDIGTLAAVTHHTGSGVTPGSYYTHHGHRGDVMLTRNGVTTTGTYGYSAFGSLKSQSGTDVSRFKFSSKEREASCSFSYYGFRFYAPHWQRWPSRDLLGEDGELNLYGFVANDPIERIDRYGEQGTSTKGKPKQSPPSGPSKPSKPKCNRCQELIDRVKKTNSDTWASDCQDFCLHMCNKRGVPSPSECFKNCQKDCDDGKIPDLLGCITSPPETKPGLPGGGKK